MVGGRCECLPCLFPFLRPEQSLPCGQCALCLPYKGLLLWETPPSNALPSLAMLPSLHLFLETWRPWWLFFPPAATRCLFVRHRVVLSPDVGAEALLHSSRAALSAYCCLQPHAVMSLGLRAGVACSRRRKHLSGRGWRGGGLVWETACPFGAKPCSSLRRKHPLPFGSQAGNKV